MGESAQFWISPGRDTGNPIGIFFLNRSDFVENEHGCSMGPGDLNDLNNHYTARQVTEL